MNWDIKNVVRDSSREVERLRPEIIGSNDASLISNSICLLSCFDRKTAESIFDEFAELMETDPDKKVLSHFLVSAKELGYNSREMKVFLDQLEEEKCGNKWSDQVWLNSLVLKALGRFDITYPKMVDHLLDKRLSNGSWFEKVWVTTYALEGLFYSHADSSELGQSADYLKSSLEEDHWGGEERGKMSQEKVTSRALQALLLIGEGYEEKPLSSAVRWSIERIKETDDLYKLIDLSVPLAYIAKGRAQKETSYRKSSAVEFRETKVEIGEKVMGDKVKEKVGTKMENSVAVRSNIGGEEEAEMEDSVAVRSDVGGEGEANVKDSVVQRSEVGGGDVEDSVVRRSKLGGKGEKKVPANYSAFTGEKIDGYVKYCPKCGTEVEEEWKCCVECGYEMKGVRELFE